MANQYFSMLPKLKEDSAVTPDRASVWEDKEYDFLNALIKSLAVSGTLKDTKSIDSIPDVWARPLLFEMALFDKEGAEQQFVRGFHERVVGEWRSILSMLALNDVKHLNLHTEEVRIGQGNSSIERILTKLKPQEINISSDTNWDVLYIIFYKDVPIAMTSPLTLVSSAADYSSEFAGSLPKPWSNDGFFLDDPIENLTIEERIDVINWLNKLDENINNHVRDNRDSERFLNILATIRSFKEDIAKSVGALADNSNTVQYKSGLLKMHAGIFRYLDNAVLAKAASAKDSAVRLMVSPQRDVKMDILLVSMEMLGNFANECNLPTTQIIVWPGLTANDVTASDLSGERNSIGTVKLTNAEIRSPEEFFTEYMAVMEPGNALKGTVRIQGEELLTSDDLSVILPIRKELLEYFTPEEIAEYLRIEDAGDAYAVHFAFPLAGVHNEGHRFDYVKMYAKKDLIYLQTNVPTIEIWPNVRRENYNKYYLYYENADSENKSELGRDFFYVLPWKYGEDFTCDAPENGLANQYTTKMHGFPEALLCTVNVAIQGNIRTQTVETGLLLLDKPMMVEEDDLSKWHIGIDFGTSSTMIYYRDNNRAPQPLNFESHLFQVTNSGAFRNNTYLRFIPSTIITKNDGSFLSIFHLLNTKKSHAAINPLQDGHIYLLGTNTSDAFTKQGSRIDSNLKWQAGDTGRYKATSYLEQICMQAIVEAAINGVSGLTWSFSYPSAFSDEERESFKKMCATAIEEASMDTGFKVNFDKLKTDLESVATAMYFNKLNSSDTNFSDGAICLDIGAGTTDISIISGQPGKIVYHTSILFAGRYLFKSIYQYVEANCLQKEDREKLKEVSPEQRVALIDAIMREKSETYLKDLANQTGKDSVKDVLEKTQLGLSGILYYVGKLLKFLDEKGLYTEKHVPDIYVGGNGSRSLYWITGGGAYDKDSIRLKALKKIIVEAAGFDDNYNFNILLSDQPKVEVASGMLQDAPRHKMFEEEEMQQKIFGNTEDEYILNSVLAGAGFTVETKDGKVDKSVDDFISAKDIAAGVNINDSEELNNFIISFNRNRKSIWFNGIKFDEVQKNEVKKRVNSYYVAEKGKDAKEIHAEPPFIMALKKMMEMMINDNK